MREREKKQQQNDVCLSFLQKKVSMFVFCLVVHKLIKKKFSFYTFFHINDDANIKKLFSYKKKQPKQYNYKTSFRFHSLCFNSKKVKKLTSYNNNDDDDENNSI